MFIGNIGLIVNGSGVIANWISEILNSDQGPYSASDHGGPYSASDHGGPYSASASNNENITDYKNIDNTNYEPEPEPIKVTVSATKIKTELQPMGNYQITIDFDNSEKEFLKKTKYPTLEIKIGNQTRRLLPNNMGKTSLVYNTQINDEKLRGEKITLVSLSGGDMTINKANAIITMDYMSKLSKDLGTVDKFVLTNKGSKGDINYDGRIDKLDVETIEKSKNKKVADVNGDGKVTVEDRKALEEAIKNDNTVYLNFLVVGNKKQHYGDVCKIDGSTGADGIINYKDFEYIANNIKNYKNYSNVYADVNGDGKVDTRDVSAVERAIKYNNTVYVKYIKVAKGSKGDVNEDGIINYYDVFAINKNAKNGDIDGNGVINVRDQATLTSIIANQDVSQLNYIEVPEGAIGDIDGNGLINAEDAQILANSLSKSNTESIIDLEIGDVNGDGKVNINDVTFIRKALNAANFGNLASKEYTTLVSYGYIIKPDESGKGDVNEDGVISIEDAQLINDISKRNEINVDKIDDSQEIAKKLANSMFDVIDPIEEPQDDKIKSTAILGDVDMNGQIGLSDVILVTKYLANNEAFPLGEEQLKLADVNKDGEVNSLDTSLMISYNLGEITEF